MASKFKVDKTRANAILVLSGLILICGIYLWPLITHLTYIPMPGTVQTTDYTVTHLQYSFYIHNRWVANGHPPMWNSSMLSGMPLIADPLTGYYYLPNWITFLYPKPITFNMLLALHFVWAGLGLYLFFKINKISSYASLFGLVAWMGTPKMIGYLGGGQVSTIFALAWLPWLLISLKQILVTENEKQIVIVACIISIIGLADIRWGYYACLLSIVYIIFQGIKRRVRFRKIFLSLLLIGFVCIILTAVLIFPMAEMLGKTERQELATSENIIFSLTSKELVGMVFPQFGSFYELITYMGIPVLFLSFISLTSKNWYWGIPPIFGILLSLGTNTPLYQLALKLIPGFSWLRVPSRFWFIVIFSFIVLAAIGLDSITNSRSNTSLKIWFRRISIAFSFFAILFGIGFAIIYPPIPTSILWFSTVVPITSFAINRLFFRDSQFWKVILVIVTAIDLGWMNQSIFQTVPLPPTPDIVKWLEEKPGLFRVYSPSYAFPPPNTLQTAEGVNPTHLLSYSDYIKFASGIDTKGYSVSVPGIYLDKFSPLDLYKKAASPNIELLGLLNVKYFASSFPMNLSIGPLAIINNNYLYENQNYRERVWIEGKGEMVVDYWSPDLIKVHVMVDKPANIIFSEISYPGWKAKVDGKEVPVDTAYGILRSLSVKEGTHEIKLYYYPFWFFIGLGLSLTGWICILFMLGVYVKKNLAHIRSILS